MSQLHHNLLSSGHISYAFTRLAKNFLAKLLFKVGNSALIEAIRDPSGNDAYFVFNQPSHYSPPTLTMHGHGAWVLDYNVRQGGSVVLQELWVPQGQGDRRPLHGSSAIPHARIFLWCKWEPWRACLGCRCWTRQRPRFALRFVLFFFFSGCAFPHHLPCGAIVAGLWSFRISSSI